jgi:hypothetical protein
MKCPGSLAMTQFCWDRATKLAASVTLKRRPGAMVLMFSSR